MRNKNSWRHRIASKWFLTFHIWSDSFRESAGGHRIKCIIIKLRQKGKNISKIWELSCTATPTQFNWSEVHSMTGGMGAFPSARSLWAGRAGSRSARGGGEALGSRACQRTPAPRCTSWGRRRWEPDKPSVPNKVDKRSLQYLGYFTLEKLSSSTISLLISLWERNPRF